MNNLQRISFILITFSLFVAACDAGQQAPPPVDSGSLIVTDLPSAVPASATLQPTAAATLTPAPTKTAVPSSTPQPTHTPESYLDYYERGKALYEIDDRDKLPEAIAQLTQAIALNPDFADAYALRAQAYLKLGQPDEAFLDAEQAVELDAQHALAHHLRGYVLALRGENEQALFELDLAIKLGQDTWRVYYHRGDLKQMMGDAEGAMEDFNEALIIDPDQADIFNSRGTLQLDLGLLDEALGDIDRAIALDDQDPGTFYNRGLIMRQLDRPQEAISAFSCAITLDRNHAWAFHNRGSVYLMLGEYENALADYDQALLLNPEDSLGFANRGYTQYLLREWEAAVLDYDRALILDSSFLRAYRERADAHLFRGDPQAAYKDYRQALLIGEPDAGVFAGRALALAFLELEEPSRADIDRALELQPNLPAVSYIIGAAFLELGDTERAIEQFDQMLVDLGISAGTGNLATNEFASGVFSDQPVEAALARFGRGRAFMAVEKQEQALADFQQAFLTSPSILLPEIERLVNNGRDDDYVYFIRGLVHAASGDWDASDADFMHALSIAATPDLHAHFLVERSHLAAAEGDFKHAAAELKQGYDLYPDRTDLAVELGLMLMESGDYEQAVEIFDAVLERQPEEVDALAYRGMAHDGLGRTEQAGVDFCHALELVDERAQAGEYIMAGFFDAYDLMILLSRKEIDCFPPEAGLSGLPNWPSDLALPYHFYAHPPGFHGIGPGAWAITGEAYGRPLNIPVRDSFWFETVDAREAVFAMAMDLHGADELGIFDDGLRPHLAEGIEARYAEGEDIEIISTGLIDGGSEIADKSFAEELLYAVNGQLLREEIASFRIGEVGVSLLQSYPADADPPIDIITVSRVLAKRIAESARPAE